MNPLQTHLILAIQRWCGLRPPSYGPSTPLPSMWARVSSAPYIWTGVAALVRELERDPFFRDCRVTLAAATGRFGPGGDIQTVAGLYGALRLCTPPSPAFN